METFYAAAAQAGAAGVHVTVTTANTRALGFYHRLGFRPLEVAEPGETTVTYLGRALLRPRTWNPGSRSLESPGSPLS